jgi:hypothetical protein
MHSVFYSYIAPLLLHLRFYILLTGSIASIQSVFALCRLGVELRLYKHRARPYDRKFASMAILALV